MTDTAPVTVMVGKRRLKAKASRAGGYWTLAADAFPETTITGPDLGKLQAKLSKLLLPKCEHIERQRAG